MPKATAPYIIDSAPVVSSNIAALGYDYTRQILAVTFKSGDIWHYAGVPSQIAEDLFAAESVGRFYTQQVKGKFTGQKMTGRCPACHAGPGRIGVICESCGDALYTEQPREERAAS